MTFACNTLSGTRRTVRDRVCSACRQHKAHQFPSFHHAQVSLALTRPKQETRSELCTPTHCCVSSRLSPTWQSSVSCQLLRLSECHVQLHFPAGVAVVSRSGSTLQCSPSYIAPWPCSSDQWSSTNSSTVIAHAPPSPDSDENRAFFLSGDSPGRCLIHGSRPALQSPGVWSHPRRHTIKVQTLSHSRGIIQR